MLPRTVKGGPNDTLTSNTTSNGPPPAKLERYENKFYQHNFKNSWIPRIKILANKNCYQLLSKSSTIKIAIPSF